ncbi:MAG: carboxypeptidase regulatory-like domain-containing protein [Patescibacteria group bacterium]|nr:carboxypeptidase regulatory-like domain-containing protein [Patescibacteria group bacterium]
MPVWVKIISLCALTAAIGLVFPYKASASLSVGSIIDPDKYAWGDKLGWINFHPSNGGLTITDTGITGYAWSDNFGWINFSPNLVSVTNNCGGILGGYAWSSQLGWINMSGVTIGSSGVFAGSAGTPGTLAGQINFSCATCNVRTDWRPCANRPSGGGGGTPGGGGTGGSTIPPPTPTPEPTPEPTPTPPTPPETPTPPTPTPTPPETPVPPTPPQEEVTPPGTTPPTEETGPGEQPGVTPPGVGGGVEQGGGGITTPPTEGGQPQPTPGPEGQPGTGASQPPPTIFNVPVPKALEPLARTINSATQDVMKGVGTAITSFSESKIGRQIIQTTEQVQQTLAEPQIQAVAVPALAAAGIATVTAAAGSAAIFNYLFFLFTQPLLLFTREKRKKYGVVYNSLSKIPIDLAAVRVIDSTGKTLQTKITDAQGRYYFLVDKGQYTLETAKKGFTFPTTLLVGQTQDLPFEELLTAPKLNLENDTVIVKNIPVDPQEQLAPLKELKRKKTLKQILSYLALTSTGLALGTFILSPSYTYLGLVIFQVLTYLMFRRLTLQKKPPSYGVVKDAKTGKPIHNAIVRIMDTRFNRVLETQISDAKGRYAFLVGHGDFYVTAAKEGYQLLRSEPIASPIGKEPTVIDKALNLSQLAAS